MVTCTTKKTLPVPSAHQALLDDFEDLAPISWARSRLKPAIAWNDTQLSVITPGGEFKGRLRRIEGESLPRVGLTLASCPSATAKHRHRVTGLPPRVWGDAAVSQAADQKCGPLGVVVLASRDQIKLFVGGSGAVHQGDGDQVLSEVAGRWVHKQTLAAGRLDGDPREGSRRRVVPLVRLCSRGRVEGSTCSRDGHGRRRVGDGHDRVAVPTATFWGSRWRCCRLLRRRTLGGFRVCGAGLARDGLCHLNAASSRVVVVVVVAAASRAAAQSEGLAGISTLTGRDVDNISLHREARVWRIVGAERERADATGKRKQLRVGYLAAAVGAATARKQQRLVAGLAAGVKVEAGLRQGADDERRPGHVVVHPFGDDVPTLAVCASALGDLDRGEVGAEVARELVDGQTLAI
ncbi:uncharacterized protein PgNI_09511 [Pyricularia grisea]|uniref:Uncharacterized protein n=1 Tax=Pyricularia grisea TaxID=148305 RepID=A0A6P8AS99_PYRGI|nr:uncharacterized protein PgNI_09511 [Pyricularia grisea]TLD04999.1 hypothetical protein PgNI_09511 [Pyricularia grisea]